MTNGDWWNRAKTPPKPEAIPVRPRDRVCTLRKDQHEATLETRVVHGIGRELIFSVNGHWRRMRVFRRQDAPIRVVVAETVIRLQGRGWRA